MIFFNLDITYHQLAGVIICVTCSVAVASYKTMVSTGKSSDNMLTPKGRGRNMPDASRYFDGGATWWANDKT